MGENEEPDVLEIKECESIMKYKNCTDYCTDYWLDIGKMTLRGEFEEMYRDIDDPWGCYEGADSLNNRIFAELLFDRRKFKRVLDIGCGLGGFTKLSLRSEVWKKCNRWYRRI